MKPFKHVTQAVVIGVVGASMFFVSLALAQVVATPTYQQVAVCTSLTHNMGYGSRDYYTGGDVTALQTYLYARGYFAYQPTGYYGAYTAKAVANWQRDNGIIAIGIVGPLTRAAIAAASCNGGVVPPTPGAPTIVSMTPTSGVVGTTVTLTGTNLTADNTVTFGTGVILHVAGVQTIGGQQILTFTVPESLAPACYYSNPRCLIVSRQTDPGVYPVSITNQSGTSNSINFTVTSNTNSAAPKIYSVTPTSGPVGTTVTITGFGFTSSNTIHFGNGAITNIPITSSIAIACTTNPMCHGGINQTLTFVVPQYVSPYCPAGAYCALWVQQVMPGSYNISVESLNGTSNSSTFTVTSQ